MKAISNVRSGGLYDARLIGRKIDKPEIHTYAEYSDSFDTNRKITGVLRNMSSQNAAKILNGSCILNDLNLWEYRTGGSVLSSPCLGPDGTVYVGSGDKKLYAIKDGVKQWEYDTGSAVLSSPCLCPEGTVYVGNNDGKLYALISPEKRIKIFEENAQNAAQNDNNNTIEIGDDWIIIGGMKVQVKN